MFLLIVFAEVDVAPNNNPPADEFEVAFPVSLSPRACEASEVTCNPRTLNVPLPRYPSRLAFVVTLTVLAPIESPEETLIP